MKIKKLTIDVLDGYKILPEYNMLISNEKPGCLYHGSGGDLFNSKNSKEKILFPLSAYWHLFELLHWINHKRNIE